MIERSLFDSTILIVDDGPENIDMLNSLLSGYKRKLAINGEKALKIALVDTPPDLILLDIMMPGIDGFEVCRRLRQDSRTQNVPIIFISAKFDKDTIVYGFEIGAQDFVTKPFDSTELLSRVKTQLQIKHQQEELESLNNSLEEKVLKRTEQLEKANKELLALDDAKNNFLHMISHEIRTPLNGILGPANLLLELFDDDEEVKDLCMMLNEATQRLDKFSTTALAITQLQTNNYKVDTENVNLLELIDNSLEVNKELILEKGLTIEKNISKKEAIVIICKELFKVAINIIISNAIKYTPEKSIISICLIRENEHYFFEVTDQGEGFDEKTRNKVLKPFGMSHSHIDKQIGIDIAFAHMVMKAHKGCLDIQRNEPSGAVVKMCFKNLEDDF